MAAEQREGAVGILSQTLSPSPTVRWILPARIRTTYNNDVVFVGENFLQLREFHATGQLADVTAKIDIGCQILSARVISAATEEIEKIDQVLEQTILDERFVVNGKPFPHAQPPQVLVVATVEGELLLLYAKQYAHGDVRFVYGKRPLLQGVSAPEQYGRHMAVDPGSRAMALASSTSHCAIFNLKQVDDIENEIDRYDPASPASFKPYNEDRFLQIDGFILRMEFLQSSPNDPDKVILLLLIANAGVTSLLLYRWNPSRSLYHVRPLICSGQRLPPEDSFPLMLIPFSKNTSFTIVTETALAVYDNILSSEAKRISIPLPKQTPDDFENSSGSPLWVQWAKPPRHQVHNKDHDDFYLIREDGELRSYIVNHKSPLKIQANFSLGRLGINVDTAFAILSGTPEIGGGDVFLAGGDMTDGCVIHCHARSNPRRLQTIPNYAPMQDLLLANVREQSDSRIPHPPARVERIFTCSGKGSGHTNIDEVRFGIEAQVGWKIEYPDAKSTTRLWPLEDRLNNKLLLLASDPMQTTILQFSMPELDVEIAEAESFPGLDIESSSLAAAVTMSGEFVQITEKAINITSRSNGDAPIRIPHTSGPCLAAFIGTDNNLIIVANKSSNSFTLTAGMLNTYDDHRRNVDFAKETFLLPEEPTCLTLASVGNINVVFVSTGTGSLLVLLVDSSRGLKLLSRDRIVDLMPGLEQSSVSSLSALSRPYCAEGFLFVGFRNGILVCMSIYLERGPPPILRLQLDDYQVLGSTAVDIFEEAAVSPDAALFALCGAELRRISLQDNDPGMDYTIASVWLTDREDSSAAQPPLNALCRIPKLSTVDDGNLSGLLMCASDGNLLINSMVHQEQAVARRIRVDGNPQRFVYSRHLNKIVAAVNSIAVVADRKATIPSRKRIIKPALQLVSPIEPSNPREVSDKHDLMVVGEHGERIRCLLNWTPSDGLKHYDMILVGLDTDAADISERSGRVICVSTKYIGKGANSTTKAKTVAKYSGKPVYALCSYGRSSLLTAAGKEVILQSLNVTTRKWSTLSRFVVPSPALSLSTQGMFIYAATSHHSLIVIRDHKGVLDFYTSDLIARNATNVLTSPGTSTVITTSCNSGTSLLGFSEQGPETRMDLLFEAVLPLTLERIKESTAASNQKSRRYYYGTCLDGTIYRFLTLQQHEWQLLRFIEDLSPLRTKRICPSPGSDLSLDDEWDAISATSAHSGGSEPHFDATQVHVRGDVVAGLIRPGPYSLRKLLAPDVKVEDGLEEVHHQEDRLLLFKTLAEPVVGDREDLTGEVIRWLRKLLRLPL